MHKLIDGTVQRMFARKSVNLDEAFTKSKILIFVEQRGEVPDHFGAR